MNTYFSIKASRRRRRIRSRLDWPGMGSFPYPRHPFSATPRTPPYLQSSPPHLLLSLPGPSTLSLQRRQHTFLANGTQPPIHNFTKSDTIAIIPTWFGQHLLTIISPEATKSKSFCSLIEKVANPSSFPHPLITISPEASTQITIHSSDNPHLTQVTMATPHIRQKQPTRVYLLSVPTPLIPSVSASACQPVPNPVCLP